MLGFLCYTAPTSDPWLPSTRLTFPWVLFMQKSHSFPTSTTMVWLRLWKDARSDRERGSAVSRKNGQWKVAPLIIAASPCRILNIETSFAIWQTQQHLLFLVTGCVVGFARLTYTPSMCAAPPVEGLEYRVCLYCCIVGIRVRGFHLWAALGRARLHIHAVSLLRPRSPA